MAKWPKCPFIYATLHFLVDNTQSSSSLDLSLVAYHGIKALCQTPKKCCQDCSVQQRTVFFVRCSDLGLVLQPQGPHIGDAPPHSRHCEGDTDMALFHKLQVSGQKFSCWKSTKTIAFLVFPIFPLFFSPRPHDPGLRSHFTFKFWRKNYVHKIFAQCSYNLNFPRLVGV